MKHTGTRAIGSSLDDAQRRLANDGFLVFLPKWIIFVPVSAC